MKKLIRDSSCYWQDSPTSMLDLPLNSDVTMSRRFQTMRWRLQPYDKPEQELPAIMAAHAGLRAVFPFPQSPFR